MASDPFVPSATPASPLDALVRHCRIVGALSGRQYQTFLSSLPTFVLAAIVLRSSPASVFGSLECRRRRSRRAASSYGMNQSSIVGPPPRLRSGSRFFWIALLWDSARVIRRQSSAKSEIALAWDRPMRLCEPQRLRSLGGCGTPSAQNFDATPRCSVSLRFDTTSQWGTIKARARPGQGQGKARVRPGQGQGRAGVRGGKARVLQVLPPLPTKTMKSSRVDTVRVGTVG